MMRLQPVIHRSQEAKRNNDIQQKSEYWKETNIPIIWSHWAVLRPTLIPFWSLLLLSVSSTCLDDNRPLVQNMIHSLSVSLMPLLSYCITGLQTILPSTHTDVPVLVEREQGRRRDERERVCIRFGSTAAEVKWKLCYDWTGEDALSRTESIEVTPTSLIFTFLSLPHFLCLLTHSLAPIMLLTQ